MTSDPMPAWQQEAMDKIRAHTAEWLPDHKLHLVLIRAPFYRPGTKTELTDPIFERLLREDPAAAQAQLQAEFLADQIAAARRDALRRFTSADH